MGDRSTRAFVVSGPGDYHRSVIAADWLGALVEVLREADRIDAIGELSVTVAPSGAIARVGQGTGQELWRVRAHGGAGTDAGGIQGAGDLRTASRRALDATLEVVPCESGAVLLLERGFLRFVAAAGPHASALLGVRLPTSAGIAGRSVQTQRTIVLGNAHGHPSHYAALDDITGYETRQIVAVPISEGGAVYGVLELMNPTSGTFGRAQVARIEEICRILAGFLAHRRHA
ncbi:MAG: GAF domain-containing protein [Alphaproteobacteria bacterium]|nr:GAF domain-containing protein [Alphaproteobacteria bacterium]